MKKQIVIYSLNIFFNNKKEQTSDKYKNTEESPKHYTKLKKAQLKQKIDQ
jgi:hypothetical protein